MRNQQNRLQVLINQPGVRLVNLMVAVSDLACSQVSCVRFVAD